MRQKRQPRYRCGTCGLRDCVYILGVTENREVPIGARGVRSEERQGEDLVHRIIVRAGKAIAGVEQTLTITQPRIFDSRMPCPVSQRRRVIGLRNGQATAKAWNSR